MIILETSRLILRHFVTEDIESLYALYCDPDVVKFIPDAPRSLQETQEEVEWFMHGHPKYPNLGLWATIDKNSGQLIGRCGLLPWLIDQQEEVEVAYLIAKEFRGRGLATEAAGAILHYAFEHLHLNRLICLIDKENLASIRVAEKTGMAFEKEGRDEIGPFQVYAIDKSHHLS